MNAQHNAGVEMTIRIGQRVRHQDYKGQRVTGVVCGLSVEDRELMVDIALDAPIVIPASEDYREVRIYRQHVPAHELAPFDEREELISGMLGLLRRMEEQYDDHPTVGLSLFIDDIRAAIAKATSKGAAS